MNIKDYNLVDSYDAERGELVLKRSKQDDKPVKLSDVLEEMPYGIVAKEETGMGATYLELKAHRNSIIVEPTKYTAYSKAKEHNAFYIGSPIGSKKGKLSDADIRTYWQSNEGKHKKFVVVADSLLRLINVVGNEIVPSTFLVIDEVDSFQTDATFRDRMEDCIDVYKMFPKENRAMVSATMLDFSDPELRSETKTVIRYDKPKHRNINLYYSEDIETTAFESISKLVKKGTGDIMIAYNSVIGCKTIADALIEREVLNKGDIAILCSEGSKEQVLDYYAPLRTNKLPAKVNFLTSAYFTGYDLNTSYHLVSVSGNKNIIHALSEKDLKQIAGRCRKGLLSETIIFNEAPFYMVKNVPSHGELIAAAERELEALKCIERNYSVNSLLKNSLDTVRELIVTHTANEGYKYVRKRSYPTEAYAVSYLNIDACIEAMRVRKELYGRAYFLLDRLKAEGHKITDDWIDHNYSIVAKTEKKGEVRQELVEKVIRVINDSKGNIQALSNAKFKTAIEREYLKAYLDHYKYVDGVQLISLLEETAIYRDSRRLNDLQLAMSYASLHKNELYKRTVRHNIKVGQSFTKEELLITWNKIYSECGLHTVLKSTVKAVRLTNLHFKTIKRRKGEKLVFKIDADNPFELRVIKYRTEFDTKKKFVDYYLNHMEKE